MAVLVGICEKRLAKEPLAKWYTYGCFELIGLEAAGRYFFDRQPGMEEYNAKFQATICGAKGTGGGDCGGRAGDRRCAVGVDGVAKGGKERPSPNPSHAWEGSVSHLSSASPAMKRDLQGTARMLFPKVPGLPPGTPNVGAFGIRPSLPNSIFRFHFSDESKFVKNTYN